jgi:hypothetical protein
MNIEFPMLSFRDKDDRPTVDSSWDKGSKIASTLSKGGEIHPSSNLFVFKMFN